MKKPIIIITSFVAVLVLIQLMFSFLESAPEKSAIQEQPIAESEAPKPIEKMPETEIEKSEDSGIDNPFAYSDSDSDSDSDSETEAPSFYDEDNPDYQPTPEELKYAEEVYALEEYYDPELEQEFWLSLSSMGEESFLPEVSPEEFSTPEEYARFQEESRNEFLSNYFQAAEDKAAQILEEVRQDSTASDMDVLVAEKRIEGIKAMATAFMEQYSNLEGEYDDSE